MKKSLLPLVLLTASSLALATVAPTVSVLAEESTTEETVEETSEGEGEASEEEGAEDETSEGEETEEAEETEEEAAEEAAEEEAVEEEVVEEAAEGEEVAEEEAAGLVLKVGYGAPHGEKSFGSAAVVLDGDVFVKALLDEYQILEAGDQWEGVPNSDAGFGDGVAEGQVLISKVANDEGYSAMMEEHAQATLAISESYAAIQTFVEGKTVAEVEAAIAELQGLGEEGNVADVVSGSTLVDTAGYLQLLVDVANEGFEFSAAEAEAVELKQIQAAPHGEKSFAVTTVAVEGDLVVAAAIDEFQFLEGEEWTGVPNSDAGFGQGYAEGLVLASKLENDEGYSAMMTEHAQATVTYGEGIKAITDFATGKTVAELEEAIAQLNELGEDGNIADVVSGSTLVDTAGYLQSIVDAATGEVAEAEEAAEGEETEAAEETEAEVSEGDEEAAGAVDFSALEDGTYTGSADGHNEPLEVEVVVEDGAITAVNVLNHAETDGIADPALTDVPAAIVEANSTDVETVSGATVTSEAIIEAVNNALAQ